jgi:hypothetical protein
MLAKMTSKNQITIPKAVVSKVAVTEYFDVEVDGGRIVLTPVRLQHANATRDKLAALGIRESDVAGAVVWARKRK